VDCAPHTAHVVPPVPHALEELPGWHPPAAQQPLAQLSGPQIVVEQHPLSHGS
jgi:hypothetical protein